MIDESECRWDDDVESAWRGLRHSLGDRLAALAEGESISLSCAEVTEEGASAHCQVHVVSGGLRLEVGNRRLDEGPTPTDAARTQRLENLGFLAAPTAETELLTPPLWLYLARQDADRAAFISVSVLRDVFGVIHPILLEIDGLESQPVNVRPGLSSVERSTWEGAAPQSPDDVRAAVTAALAGLGAEGLKWDDDGDLPLATERCLLWVTVSHALPRILLHCTLVDGLTEHSTALAEVNRLNREHFGLTFVFQRQRIAVTREVGLAVVSLGELAAEIQRLLDGVDGWAAEVSDRLQGAGEKPPDQGRERFDTAYAVMVELEREQRGSVGSETMARIFEHDTGLLLRAVRLTEQRRRDQRRRVRKARERGRDASERAAQARQDYLRDVLGRMRAALRLIVDAPVRAVQLDQLSLFDEDECGTTR